MALLNRKRVWDWAIVVAAGGVGGSYIAGFFPGLLATSHSMLRTGLFALSVALLASLYFITSSRTVRRITSEGLTRDCALSFLPVFTLLAIPLFIPRFSISMQTYFSPYVERLGPKLLLFGAILAGHLFIRASSKPQVRERLDAYLSRHWGKILGGIVFSYAAFFLVTGLWDFHIFGNWHDLSRFTTSQYSLTKGEFFLSRLHTQSGSKTLEFVGDHFAPIKLFIVPFFLIFKSAAVFLVLKTLAMAFSAVGFYYLARLRLRELESFLLTVAYLLIPTAISQNYTGFHPVCFATLLIPLAVYFFIRRRFGWFITFMVLCSGMKENVPFIMLLFAGLALIQGRPRKWVIWPIVINVLWLVLVFVILFPSFRAADNMMIVRYPYISSISDLLLGVVKNPLTLLGHLGLAQKQEYIFYLLAPFFFVLPFRSAYSLMGLMPAAVVVGLMSWEVPITFHHGILPSSFFAIATMLGIARRSSPNRRTLSISISVLISLVALILIPIWWGAFKCHPDPYFNFQKAALSRVPPGVPAAAPRYMLPHLASRNEVYFLARTATDPPDGAQYVIVDSQKITAFWEPDVVDEVKRTGGLRDFDLIWQGGPMFVFKRSGLK
ncbi:DUF2079 domain-containing protein [bacterium]|nr:DUF2079 domain-containing protein [bacterium]